MNIIKHIGIVGDKHEDFYKRQIWVKGNGRSFGILCRRPYIIENHSRKIEYIRGLSGTGLFKPEKSRPD